MAKLKGAIVIDIERCKGCEVCVGACPESSNCNGKAVNGKGYHYAESVNDDCTGCTNCAVVCPDGVITVYRVKSLKYYKIFTKK